MEKYNKEKIKNRKSGDLQYCKEQIRIYGFCCIEKVVELFDADMPIFLWLPAGKSYRRSQQLQIR